HWQDGHLLAGADGEQGRAPELARGLEQHIDEDVKRTQADPQFMQRLTVVLLEMRDSAEHRLARKKTAGVGQHRGESADTGRNRRVRGRGGELPEWAQVAIDLRFKPA